MLVKQAAKVVQARQEKPNPEMTVTLDVRWFNVTARRLYVSLGFQEIERTYPAFYDWHGGVKMQCALAALVSDEKRDRVPLPKPLGGDPKAALPPAPASAGPAPTPSKVETNAPAPSKVETSNPSGRAPVQRLSERVQKPVVAAKSASAQNVRGRAQSRSPELASAARGRDPKRGSVEPAARRNSKEPAAKPGRRTSVSIVSRSGKA